MLGVVNWLFDPSGFVPRRECGAWTPELIWLHAGSDILIWLAYTSIPVVLAYFAIQQRTAVGKLNRVVWLFAAFILACGLTHLVEAVIFQYPVYRLSGVAKAVTAVVSWATVIALVPLVPQVLAAMRQPGAGTGLALPALGAAPPPAEEPAVSVVRRYMVAVLAAVLAVLVRAAFQPILNSDHAFVLPLVGVVFVAWYGGFGPAMVSLFLSLAAVTYLFIPPTESFVVEKLSDQFAVGLFAFAGLVCAMLGEAQRQHARTADRHLADLRASEAAVRDRERHFREVAESLPQLVWTCRADGPCDYLSPQWVAYTGRPAEEQLGYGWLDHIHPDDRDGAFSAWMAAARSGGLYATEFRIRRHDGEYRWFQTQAAPLRDESGRVAKWFGTNTDIHDRKRAEDDLRASEARFRTLTEAIPQMVWNADAVGRVSYVNTRWRDYTGLDAATALDDWWPQVIHPDEGKAVQGAWRAAVVGDPAPFVHEVRVRRHDGVYRWFQTTVVPLRRTDGGVDQWIGSLSDIHAQKTEAARLELMVADRTLELRTQRVFLDTILENVADGIVACDPDGKLKLFNAATRRFHGLPAEPIPPDQWADRYDLFEGDGQTPLATDRIPLFRALRGEAVRDAEMVIAPKDGPARFLLASGQPLTDPDGRPLGAVVSMRDVTVEREAERARAEFEKELRRSNEELEQFAYIASHDLQEPLRKIQAFGDRLRTKNRDQFDDAGRDYLDRMLAAATRMRTLITDLLALSRVTTAARPFDRVDLRAVAEGVVGDLDYRLSSAGGLVEVGDLGVVTADPTQMRQLFQNLIGNALKFSRPGVPLVVRVAGELADGEYRLTVADNGIGFDDEYREKIFEVFQRLHARDQYDGTGIGLAICRKIAERHGGTIVASGRPGAGATFVVTLPAQEPQP